MLYKSLIVLSVLAQLSLCKVYFREDFSDADWTKRWVQSTYSGKEFGEFKWTAGKFYGDSERDKGIQTSADARFYAISAKFPDNAFSTEGKDLVVQFSVKHEQNIDCGGGYLKVFDCSLDQTSLHGESPYLIMFGPDICGPGTKKVHVIFNYKGKNLLINKDIRCKDDVFTHVYRLVVKPDNTYKVLIDGEVVEKGELEKDWSFLAPKKIKDPEAKKPEDWDDRAKIDDVTDTKPDDWDQPEYIPDPDATKPEDWDDEMDGEWEPPQINNPAFKGEWKPKQIDNPAYKGPWVHPEIDNPEYVPDSDLYLQKKSVVSDSIYGKLKPELFSIMSSSLTVKKEADEVADVILNSTIKDEKKMKDEQDVEEKKASESETKEEKEEEKEEEPKEDKDDEEEEDHEHDHSEL